MKQLIAAVTATPVYNITEDTRVLVSPRSARARGDAGRVQGCESRGARAAEQHRVGIRRTDARGRYVAARDRLDVAAQLPRHSYEIAIGGVLESRERERHAQREQDER